MCFFKKTETPVVPPPISTQAAPISCSSSTNEEIADTYADDAIPANSKSQRFTQCKMASIELESTVSKCISTERFLPICPLGSNNPFLLSKEKFTG